MLGLALFLTAFVAPTAQAATLTATQFETALVAAINKERETRGLSTLAVNSSVTTVARTWSGKMAGANSLTHNPSYSSQMPSGWTLVAENVAYGSNSTQYPPSSIHTNFMNSAGHRANILRPGLTHIGVGVAFISRNGQNQVWVTQNFAAYPTATPVSSPVAPFAQMVSTMDVSGAGHADVFTVDRNGRLYVWAGRGDGTLRPGVLDGTGWGSMTIYAPGDWTGDGRADLLARDSSGRLWVYPGNGAGKLGTRSLVGLGWSGYQIAGVGDMTGDGKSDVLAVDTRGRLWLYPGTGTGAMKPRVYAGDRWSGYRLHAAGDMNRDGQADVLSVDSKGQLWFYAGQGYGKFAPRVKAGTGWGSFRLASGADLTGDAMPDLLGRDSSGRLFVYTGKSPGVFSSRVLVRSGW